MSSRHIAFLIICGAIIVPILCMLWSLWRLEFDDRSDQRMNIVTSKKIRGRFNEYVCDFYRYGKSYVAVYVFANCLEKRWFGLKTVSIERRVWKFHPYYRDGMPMFFNHARIAKPGEVMKWYRDAVDQYEEYLTAWTSQFENNASTVTSDTGDHNCESDGKGVQPSIGSATATQFAASMVFLK